MQRTNISSETNELNITMNTPINSARKSISAFTLIELLVVISIISLLMAILLPALGAARETAMWSNNQANLRQVLLASLNYAADNKDGMMWTRDVSKGWRWALTLMYNGYMNDRKIFWSPMRDTRFLFLPTYINDFNAASVTLGYSYNALGIGPESDNGSKLIPRNISKTRLPLATILVFSEQFDPAYYTQANSWRDGSYSLGMSASNNNYFTWKGNAVQAYLDGHVKTSDSMELYWKATDPRNGVYNNGSADITNYFGYGCLRPYYDMRAANNANLP